MCQERSLLPSLRVALIDDIFIRRVRPESSARKFQHSTWWNCRDGRRPTLSWQRPEDSWVSSAWSSLPLLSQDELDLLVAKADTSANHCKRLSTRQLSVEEKHLCATIAEKENDAKKRERLANAECGLSWMRRVLSTSNTLDVYVQKSVRLVWAPGCF